MIISLQELSLRVNKLKAEMKVRGCTSLLLRSIPAHLYLSGSVFQGFTFVHQDLDYPVYFPDRPTDRLEGLNQGLVHMIRKPEMIPSILTERFGLAIDEGTAVELGYLPAAEFFRLQQLSPSCRVSTEDATDLLRVVRSIKTDEELRAIRKTAALHCEVIRVMPELYRPGMTDMQWQHEIEYQMRRRGSLGIFRAFGPRMEIFMGNLITGDNAQTPAPYDFAMGGGGVPGMPFGANGTTIRPGMSVMVDMAGNFGTYLSDITRTFALGKISDTAMRAHHCAIELHEWFMERVHPGMPISDPYNHCMDVVAKEGLQEYFMGTEFQSKFVGHGLGLEINEPPVLTARWKGCFEPNMAIAFEPKFVIPGVGPVGVENTYIVTGSGVENISPLPMEIISLRGE